VAQPCDVLQLRPFEVLCDPQQDRGRPGQGEQPGHADEAAEQAPVHRQRQLAANRDVLKQREVERGTLARHRIAPDEEACPHHHFGEIHEHDGRARQDEHPQVGKVARRRDQAPLHCLGGAQRDHHAEGVDVHRDRDQRDPPADLLERNDMVEVALGIGHGATDFQLVGTTSREVRTIRQDARPHTEKFMSNRLPSIRR